MANTYGKGINPEAVPEMLKVMERALKLSQDHPDFKLCAMEPFWQAIAKAKKVRK